MSREECGERMRANSYMVIVGLLLCLSGQAVDLPPQPAETAPPKIREISSGEWTVGAIQLSKKDGTVSFPARVNLTDGLLEYLLVHNTGKTHESLFSTDVPPYHLQIAMLLLGAKGADPKVLTNAPPSGPINNADLLEFKPPPVPGDPVELTVSWKSGNTNVVHPIESLVMSKKNGKAMREGTWRFSGSMVWEGAFIAQIEGSVMAIITDISAMFNSGHPERDRDSLWYIREKMLPPEKAPVTIKIKLLKKAETKKTGERPSKERDAN